MANCPCGNKLQVGFSGSGKCSDCSTSGGCVEVAPEGACLNKEIMDIYVDIWDDPGCDGDNVVRVFNTDECIFHDGYFYWSLEDMNVDMPPSGKWSEGVTKCEMLKPYNLVNCAGEVLASGSSVPTCEELTAKLDALPKPEKCGGGEIDGQVVQCDQFDALLSAALADDETCYDLPMLDSACNITKVAYAEVDGCGKLFKYTKDPLPQGMQFITRGVNGTLQIPLDGTGTWDGEFFWAGGGEPANNIQYKVFEACKTFSKDDFCLLGVAGRSVQIVSDTRVGYYITTTEDYPTGTLLPYQLLTEVSANGTLVKANTDAYGINADGRNHHQTDLIEGVWVTDGNDVTICVKVAVVAQGSTTGTFGNHADVYEMDMAQIGITMNLV